MNDQIIKEVEFLKETNELAAKVYSDKKYFFLTYREIAKYRNMTVAEAKEYFLRAKSMLSHKESAWLDGLSPRAKKAVLDAKYHCVKDLCHDVVDEMIDLENMKGIGHKVAVEIRRWCVSRQNA